MKTNSWFKKATAVTLVLLMLFALLPVDLFPLTAQAADSIDRTVDPSTAMSYEDMLGTDKDGNRYAGRIWADKSVFAADSVTLDGFTVENTGTGKAQEFIITYSALGSTTTVSTTTTVNATTPRDIVLVIDTSYSMTGMEGGKTRMQHVVDAADVLVSTLDDGNNRIGVVTYDATSSNVVPLDKYTNMRMSLRDRTITVTSDQGNFQKTGGSGTNIQAGIHAGMEMLRTASNKTGRAPVIIILTDGEANRADRTSWENPGSGQTATSGDDRIIFGTILNAAYQKTRVEAAYGMDAVVYTVSVDLDEGSLAHAIMDPKTNFNSSSTGTVNTAYGHYTSWAAMNTTYTVGNRNSWQFNQVPAGTSKQDVIANINYSDKYFDVKSSSGALADAFDTILEEIQTGSAIFHPITDSVTSGTGDVEETPLTYVDPIGEYMELKSILAVTLYNTKYAVAKDTTTSVETTTATGEKLVTETTRYLVGSASDTIIDPVDGQAYSLRDSINIELIETYTKDAGTGAKLSVSKQELWVRIKEAALPLLKSTVVNKDGNITYSSQDAKPIRLYYSLGLSEDILAADGTVMVSRISQAYRDKNTDSSGKISFYTNQYGLMAPNAPGTLTYGDSHISATPSLINRYYYHQTNFPVYKTATDAAGNPLTWEPGEYGTLWYEGNGTEDHYEANKNPNNYRLELLTLADVSGKSDADEVYTFISFYRPTSGGAGTSATYLAFATWGQMRADCGFFDNVNKVYINGADALGNYITSETVGYTVDPEVAKAYAAAKGLNHSDIVACLGLNSWRVYRLDHMTEAKTSNNTGTAADSYAPKYDTENDHVGNLVVWLGNNGKMTLDPTQGFSLTKRVAGDIGTVTSFEFSIVFDNGNFTPSVRSGNGDPITSGVNWDSSAKTLTVTLVENQTVYVIGVPKDTAYTIKETTSGNFNVVINDDLNTNQDDTYEGTVINNVFTNVTATNTEKGKGGVYITKEVDPAGNYSTPSGDRFPITITIENNKNANRVLMTDTDGDDIPETLVNGTDYTSTVSGTTETITLNLGKSQTLHISELSHGATVTVEEGAMPTTANGTYTQASVPYTSSDYSGQPVENNGAVTISENRFGTVVVHNIYTRTQQVSVDLNMEVTKQFPNMPALTETFNFRLEKYNGSTWDAVTGTSVAIPSSALTPENNYTASVPLNDILNGILFNAPGTYSYRIVEVAGGNSDITYDASVYTFAVTVTDDGNGGLQAQVVPYTATLNGNTVSATFVNEYHTAETHLDIQKDITDLSGSGKTPAGFVIETYEASVAGGIWTEGAKIREGTTDAEGNLRLSRNYRSGDFTGSETVKTYHFIIKEKDTNLSGWHYDETRYGITVVLTKHSDSSITAVFTEVYKLTETGTITGNNLLAAPANTAELSFTNSYTASPIELNLNTIPTIQKELIGRNLRASDNFTFEIVEVGDMNGNGTSDELIATSTGLGINPAQPNIAAVTFSPLTYTKAGVYRYKVREVPGSNPAITYSTQIYDLVVTVVDEGGQLAVSYIFEDSVTHTATFTNVYTAQNAQVTIGGTKALTGDHRHLNAGEFGFELLDGSTQIAVAANKADGTFTFDPITYTLADLEGLPEKEFTYTVKEIPGTLGGITYDGKDFAVTVKVTDDGTGKLSAVVTYSEAVAFTNVYDAKQNQPLTVTGKKEMAGRDLEAGEFTFVLLDGGHKIKETTNSSDGSFSFTFEAGYFETAGTYYYVLGEAVGSAPGVTYDLTEFIIAVTVTDNGNGELTASYSTTGAIGFVNTYDPSDAKVSISGTKVLNGRDTPLAAGEFSFSLYRTDENYDVVDEEPIVTVENDAAGNFTLPEGIFTAVAENYYILVEEPYDALRNSSHIDKGITYDATQYKINISVTDLDAGNKHTGALKATVTVNGTKIFTADAAGLTAVTDLDFTNTYHPGKTYVDIGGTGADISATKTLDGKTLTAGSFTFKLWNSNALWEKVSERETVSNDASGVIDFTALEYDTPDTYYYIVEEVNESKGGITYDSTLYYITVKVTDNQQGSLVAETTVITNKSTTPVGSIAFQNTYTAAPAKVTLQGKKEYDKPLTGNDFTFILKGKTDSAVINEKKTNAKDGSIVFSELVFGKTGDYNFTVEEEIGILGFIKYSKVVHEVKVTVTDNGTGELVAAVTVDDKSDGKIIFQNVYQFIDADDAVTISGSKKLSGFRTQVHEGEFSFGLYKGTQEIEVVKVKADGTFAFTTLTYGVSDIGTHTYTVKEIIPAGAVENVFEGRTYDPTVYTVTVTVADNNEGKIVATSSIAGSEAIVFNNKYAVESAKVSLSGTKTYDKPLVGNDYTFLLDGEIDGVKIKQEKKNDANGNILFDQLTFTKEGTYTFTVKELEEALGFIQYSKVVHEVKVTVKDNDAGKLVAAVTVNDKSDGKITFVNDYQLTDPDRELVLSGTKNLTGRDLAAGEFSFGLYDETGALLEKVTNDASGVFTFSKLTFEVGENETVTHTYTVKEIAGSKATITYDKTVYTVVVTLKDNNQGGVDLSYTVNGAADGKLVFNNVYKAIGTPETGDNFPVIPLAILMLLCAVDFALTLILIKRRRRRNWAA